ncbi:MAG: YezD family protein [Lachnospiraceae bacterium]|nr:YezD family protein [Lachnospiraceae bacterium]
MDQNRQNDTNQRYLELAKKMIDEIRFGQIIITVQDKKIVQVEQNKKIRL